MKVLIISGISIQTGGALTILNLVFEELANDFYKKYRIIFIIQDKDLINFEIPGHIEILEIPLNGSKWLKRVYHEFFGFRKLSRRIKPYLWLSLHEITPCVKSQKRAVYCHHSHLFVKHRLIFFRDEPTILIFKIVFDFLNRLTVRKNDYVIVQQNWMRQGFINRYLVSQDKIIVAPPRFSNFFSKKKQPSAYKSIGINKRFIYPVFPRSFKNIEIICEAAITLEKKGINNFEFLLTIEGNENRYSNRLVKKYSYLNSLKFIGLKSHDEIIELYSSVDFLIFSSFIESWGLPITEFKFFNKPIILADLPYAKETLGNYDKVLFFDAKSVDSLVSTLQPLIEQSDFSEFENHSFPTPAQPFADSWKALFEKLLE